MIELYPEIRAFHIAMISLSGLMMATRGGAVLMGARWPQHIAVRILAWTVDATVLTTAIMLVTSLPHGVFANGWLWVKLVWVSLYFGAGYAGLSARRPRRMQALLLGLATVAYALAIGTARAHDPMGWLRLLGY